MKVGEYEEFDKYCGIACVENEVTKKEWYVVFADIFKSEYENIRELGQVISRGKDREEALINAIKFLISREVDYGDALDEENKYGKNIVHQFIEFLNGRSLTNDPHVILPMKAWTHNYEKGCIEDIEGKFWNADIIIYEGKAVEATI